MSAIRWWYVLFTWSITGVACRACHSSVTFFHCDTHMRMRKKKTHARSWWWLASAGHKSLGLVLIFWQNLTGHGDDVWLVCVDCRACCWFGTVASLWHVVSDLIICFARPRRSWIFLCWQNLVGRGSDLHLVMPVIWRSCTFKYRLSCFKCHLPGLFSLCFTCSMHTHPLSETCHTSCDWFFFWKRAEVWTIETQKKRFWVLGGLSVSLFFFYRKTKFLLMKGEEKLEYMRWQGSSCSPTLACSHTTFFLLSGFVFWAIMLGDSFFCSFFFTCIFNSICNFSHYKFVKESNIRSLSLTRQKKKQKDGHVILVN